MKEGEWLTSAVKRKGRKEQRKTKEGRNESRVSSSLKGRKISRKGMVSVMPEDKEG